MKPSALYRSITFWSGILTMLFIACAWRDSYFNNSWAASGRLSLSNTMGGLMVERDISPFKSSKVYREPNSTRYQREAVPALFFLRGRRDTWRGPAVGFDPTGLTMREISENWARFLPGDCWTLFIPHWMILLASSVPWGLLLMGRRRRWRARAF